MKLNASDRLNYIDSFDDRGYKKNIVAKIRNLANVRAKMLLFFQFVWLTNCNDIKVDSEKTKSGSNSEPWSPTTSLRQICVYPMVMHENLPIHVQNANKLYAISIWLSYALNAFEKIYIQ